MARSLDDENEMLILLLIREAGILGRYRLSQMLSVPAGVARGMLSILERRGLVRPASRRGCTITAKGTARLSRLLHGLTIAGVRRLESHIAGTTSFNVVFHVRGGADRVRMGIEQRDAAIKAGASGAITLVFDGKAFRFPGVREKLRATDHNTLKEATADLKPKQSDTLIVAFGSEWWHAVRGGLLACATLRV